MIELDYFSEKLEELQELTTGFPLRMSLKSRLYEKFFKYDTEQFDYVYQQILNSGEKITYNTLLKYFKLAPRKREVKAYKKIVTVEECDNRMCNECTVDDCRVLGREIMNRLECLFDKDMHEKAIIELKELFPNINWDQTYTKAIGVKIDEKGDHIPIYPQT